MKRAATYCLRDKAKIAFFSKLSNFYFDLRPPAWKTPGQTPRENVRIPGGSPGGWSGLELTDTLI